MAQNIWINVTADKSAANRPNATSHLHIAVGGAAAANDFTVSLDNTVITNLAIYDTCAAAARQRAIAAGLK